MERNASPTDVAADGEGRGESVGIGSQNGSTSGEQVIAEPWRCSRQGHEFRDVAGPQPHLCLHCPTVGAPCPDCQSKGAIRLANGPVGRCSRCDGTGWIEYVEIRHGEFARQRRDARRFTWLIEEWACVVGMTTEGAIREIDDLLASGAGKGGLAARVLGLLDREIGGGKAQPGPKRVRTPGNDPARGSSYDESTLSQKSVKA